MGTTTEYTDTIDALDELDKAAKRLEAIADLLGPTEANYPLLQSAGSKHGAWLVMHDMINTVQKVTNAIMEFQKEVSR